MHGIFKFHLKKVVPGCVDGVPNTGPGHFVARHFVLSPDTGSWDKATANAEAKAKTKV